MTMRGTCNTILFALLFPHVVLEPQRIFDHFGSIDFLLLAVIFFLFLLLLFLLLVSLRLGHSLQIGRVSCAKNAIEGSLSD